MMYKRQFFKILDVEMDGSENLQIDPLRFYFQKSCRIAFKLSEIYNAMLIVNF